MPRKSYADRRDPDGGYSSRHLKMGRRKAQSTPEGGTRQAPAKGDPTRGGSSKPLPRRRRGELTKMSSPSMRSLRPSMGAGLGQRCHWQPAGHHLGLQVLACRDANLLTRQHKPDLRSLVSPEYRLGSLESTCATPCFVRNALQRQRAANLLSALWVSLPPTWRVPWGIADIATLHRCSSTQAKGFRGVRYGSSVQPYPMRAIRHHESTSAAVGCHISHEDVGTWTLDVFGPRRWTGRDSSTYEPSRNDNQPLQRSAVARAIRGIVTVLDGPHEIGLEATRLAAVGVDGHAGSPVVLAEPAPEPAPEPAL
jgi:hypothetical protein